MKEYHFQDLLEEIIGNNNIDAVRDYMVENGANRDEMTDISHLANWIEDAPWLVKENFLDKFNEDDYPSLRVCTNCGCFMNEGYLLETQYACSDACAIALYGGDEKRLREDIHESVENDYGDCFWTQWF